MILLNPIRENIKCARGLLVVVFGPNKTPKPKEQLSKA